MTTSASLPRQTIGFIRIPHFYAQVEQVLKPDLRSEPFVIVGSHTPDARILDYNQRAALLGITHGLSLEQVLSRAPSITVLAGSLGRYLEFSSMFYRLLSSMSPAIEPVSLNEAYVDWTQPGTRWISAEECARDLQRLILRELELPLKIGIASSKLAAQIAALQTGAMRYTVVPRGEEKRYIAPCAVSVLPGIGPRTRRMLKSNGIRTVRDLARLSPSELEAWFGPSGWQLHQLAHGRDPRWLTASETTKSLSRTMRLDGSPRPTEPLYRACRVVSRHLRSTQRKARTVRLLLKDQQGVYHSRQKTLPSAFSSTALLYQYTRQLLQSHAQSPGDADSLTVLVTNLTSHSSAYSFRPDLFRMHPRIRTSLVQLKKTYGLDLNQHRARMVLKPKPSAQPEKNTGFPLLRPAWAGAV